MLNTIFFLSDKPIIFKRELQRNKDCRIYCAVLLDGSDVESMEKAYKFFSDNQENCFLLLIKVDSHLSNLTLEIIVSFFFIPSYYRSDGKLLVTLVSFNDPFFESAKRRLTDFSFAQGIENLMINRIHSLNKESEQSVNSKSRPNFIYSDTEDLLKDYTTILKSEMIFGHLFYLNNPQIDPYRLYNSIQEIEASTKSEYPVKFEIADKMQSVLNENDYLRNANLYISNELYNYKEHNLMLRSSHEAKLLQEYYRHEYENLPLWYKRFGHIIKVITGKRTFGSLFNDSVKKYKD